jgi:hypothetical protein
MYILIGDFVNNFVLNMFLRHRLLLYDKFISDVAFLHFLVIIIKRMMMKYACTLNKT